MYFQVKTSTKIQAPSAGRVAGVTEDAPVLQGWFTESADT